MWWKDLRVSLKSYSDKHISVKVELYEYENSWIANGIYGWPDRAYKFRTWEFMHSLMDVVQVPYVFFGDFNEILRSKEKEGGTQRCVRDVEAFRNCVHNCDVVDLGYRGSWFTWHHGNSPTTYVRERLDRFLASPG